MGRITQSPAPLHDFAVVRSTDPVETHERATSLMNEHGMRVLGEASTFEAEIRRASVESLQLLHFDYGTAVEIRPAPLEDFVCVHIPLAGRCAVSSNHGDAVFAPGTAAVMSPTDHVQMRWSRDLQLLVLRVDCVRLDRKLRALTGRRSAGPVTFAPTVAAAASGATLIRTILMLQSSLDDAGPAGLPTVLATEFEELVLSLLLLMHEHDRSDEIAHHTHPSSSRVVHLATEFARENSVRPLSVGDLARAAHVSERVLFDAFRHEFGCSPMAWVRDLRLQRARLELLAADPAGGATVARIAAANGLGHLGRFAAEYRARFGEAPSETLRR